MTGPAPLPWPAVRRALRGIPWAQPVPARAAPAALRLLPHLRLPLCMELIGSTSEIRRLADAPHRRLIEAVLHTQPDPGPTLPLWPDGVPA
ncbi:hypothetical protein CBQ26_00725 [Deinococcus indicus]|uniref:Uncharacterized protein n=1 Tax=Deinococcus indicus TaxID=223556 RepID=A0A246BTK3_9DEIO|nr:hypothetical protein [Deinococcus indicus]OWL99016.1 hypothetical protein CBQ26_00725 [Deinococcus indicus]